MRFVFDNHIAGDHITSFVDGKITEFFKSEALLGTRRNNIL